MPRHARPRIRMTFVAIALLAIATGAADDGARRHPRLLRSIPARDTVMTALPKSIQLWFSEPIELAVSRVRLVDGDAKSIALAPLWRDASATDAPVSAPVPSRLHDGVWMVYLTTASKDGHVVRDSFAFTLKTR